MSAFNDAAARERGQPGQVQCIGGEEFIREERRGRHASYVPPKTAWGIPGFSNPEIAPR